MAVGLEDTVAAPTATGPAPSAGASPPAPSPLPVVPDMTLSERRGAAAPSATPRLGAGTKFGIDATRKIRGEDAEGVVWDAPIARAPQARVEALRAELEGRHGIRSIAKLDGYGGPRLLYVTIEKNAPGAADRAIDAIWSVAPPGFGDLVLVALDEGSPADPDRVAFQFAANACPRRDARRSGERIAFDGTPKLPGEERGGEPVRDFPPGVNVDEATAQRVSQRWREYGFES